MTTPAQRWSALHHGIDPRGVRLLSGWLTVMWALARPLARLRVPPTALTLLGVLFGLDAVLLARARPWAAVLAVLAAVLCDGLDGAVAVLGDAATRLGARADAVADRITDLAFAAVLWRLGVPWWLAALAGAVAVAVDVLRRVRHRPALITVAERPSWTVCTVLAAGSAALTSTTGAWQVLACGGVWLGLGAAGLVQVARSAG